MEGNQKYWDMEIEPILNSPEIREIQWEKMQLAVKYLYDNVPFDRRRMDKARVEPEDIRSLKDFSKAVPMAGQNDYRELIEETGQDMDLLFNDLFGQKRFRDIYLLCTTSGTTGIPTPYPFFKRALSRHADIISRIAWRVGVRTGDRLALCYGLSMHGAGTPQILWLRQLPGITIYPIGAEAGTEKILKLIKLFKINVFCGTPSLALHLVERAPEVLKGPVSSGLKTLWIGAEPGVGIPEVKARLESEYDAKVFDMSGFGCSCDYPEYQGMHWIADDYCYYELVDPNTKESIPLDHGSIGQAVYTPLEPETPLFFYNLRITTNDIHQVFTESCPCGMSGFRYKIIGRSDDMLKVKGVPVYPSAIQGVINSFVPRVSGAFRILLEEPPPRVVPPLKLKVEYGDKIQKQDLDVLKKEIQEEMHNNLKIRPDIIWLKPKTLERATKKTQLFEKLYEKE